MNLLKKCLMRIELDLLLPNLYEEEYFDKNDYVLADSRVNIL